jgi:hypothetical protein
VRGTHYTNVYKISSYIHFDKSHYFFQNCLFLFLRMKKDEPKIILFVIFHYGLDHGLQLKSYLNLIMKSNYWLLQVEKGEKKIKSFTVNSFNFASTNFRGLGKKAFRGIVKFMDCRLQKIKKKGFEILKFVDFHFKFVDFACRDSTVKCSF